MPEESINAAIDQAVAEAEEQGVIGKESTPFLLARVAELTGGDSLKSNIQLVFNNAILASEIAKEYQRWWLISMVRKPSPVLIKHTKTWR
ncbi:pseudouridine-5'-phosphate glycosidase [Escherichia coli]